MIKASGHKRREHTWHVDSAAKQMIDIQLLEARNQTELTIRRDLPDTESFGGEQCLHKTFRKQNLNNFLQYRKQTAVMNTNASL